MRGFIEFYCSDTELNVSIDFLFNVFACDLHSYEINSRVWKDPHTESKVTDSFAGVRGTKPYCEPVYFNLGDNGELRVPLTNFSVE